MLRSPFLRPVAHTRSAGKARRAARHPVSAILAVVSKGGDERVLHLIWSDWDADVPYLVSSETLAAAHLATADDAPRPPMDFGDLRRDRDIDGLERHLPGNGCDSLEQYVAGIERAAGRPPGSGEISTRLEALRDFVFDGDDTATDDYDYLPADDVDFREEQIAWDEPAVRYWNVIAPATAHDLPSDLAAEYCADRYATGSPGSSGEFIDSSVDPDRLGELIAELEARRYKIIRDQPRAP